MRTVQEYCYCREDIANILETTPNCISQHVKRGHLQMDDLKSVLLFLAQYGPDHLRFEVLKAAAWRPETKDPGGWKRKKAEAKKPKRGALKD